VLASSIPTLGEPHVYGASSSSVSGTHNYTLEHS